MHELTFYLAAVLLLVLTAESCLKLLKGESFGIAVVVYVTAFAWYFVDTQSRESQPPTITVDALAKRKA